MPLTTTRSSIRRGRAAHRGEAGGEDVRPGERAARRGLAGRSRGARLDRRRETRIAQLEKLHPYPLLHLAGGLGVDEAEAEIGIAAGIAEVLGGGGKGRLDPVGGTVGCGVDQIGDGAGHDRGGEGGAGDEVLPAADRGDDVDAGRRDEDVGPAIGLLPSARPCRRWR